MPINKLAQIFQIQSVFQILYIDHSTPNLTKSAGLEFFDAVH